MGYMKRFKVIPADAGIQRKIIHFKMIFIAWIPAFAGMTQERQNKSTDDKKRAG